MKRSALFVTTVPITLEAFLVPFAEHFRSEGWRIDALANGAEEDAAIAEAFDMRYDIGWSRDPLDRRNFGESARRVREVVGGGGYDIVHVHTPIASFVTRWALRRSRGPRRPVVIYTAHGFHFYKGGRPLSNALYRTLERIDAPWTDYLVTINREDYEAARSIGGIDPGRVRLIPGIGVDTERFSPAAVSSEEAAAVRAGLDVADGDFLLTMVAEFAPVKRHRLALRALAEVRDPRVVLALVGEGPLEPEVRREVERLGLSERVRFAGYRRDIPAVLAASDAVLLVSEREGLNRSVLEAMACGRPVIGTDTRGIADAVGSSAGWIVPKNDAAAIARAIAEAAGDRDEPTRRGAAARERAVAEFSLQRVVKAYEGLYREALASRV